MSSKLRVVFFILLLTPFLAENAKSNTGFLVEDNSNFFFEEEKQTRRIQKLTAYVGECSVPFQGVDNIIGSNQCIDVFPSKWKGGDEVNIKIENPNQSDVEIQLSFDNEKVTVQYQDKIFREEALVIPGKSDGNDSGSATLRLKFINYTKEKTDSKIGIVPQLGGNSSQLIELQFNVNPSTAMKLEKELKIGVSNENKKDLEAGVSLKPGGEYELTIGNPNFHPIDIPKIDNPRGVKFQDKINNIDIPKDGQIRLPFNTEINLNENIDVDFIIEYEFQEIDGKASFRRTIEVDEKQNTTTGDEELLQKNKLAGILPIFFAVFFGGAFLLETRRRFILQSYHNKIRAEIDKDVYFARGLFNNLMRRLGRLISTRKDRAKIAASVKDDLRLMSEGIQKKAGNIDQNFSRLENIRYDLGLREQDDLKSVKRMVSSVNAITQSLGLEKEDHTSRNIPFRLEQLKNVIDDNKKGASDQLTQLIKEKSSLQADYDKLVKLIKDELGLVLKSKGDDRNKLRSIKDTVDSLTRTVSTDKGQDILQRLKKVQDAVKNLQLDIRDRDRQIKELDDSLEQKRKSIESLNREVKRINVELEEVKSYKKLVNSMLQIKEKADVNQLAVYLQTLKDAGVDGYQNRSQAEKRLTLWQEQEKILANLWEESSRVQKGLSVKRMDDLMEIKDTLLSKVDAAPSDIPGFAGQFSTAMEIVLANLQDIKNNMRADSYFEEHVRLALEGRGQRRGLQKLVQDLSDRKSGGAFYRIMGVSHVDDYMKIKPEDFYQKFIRRYLAEFNSIGILNAYATAKSDFGINLSNRLEADRVSGNTIQETYEYLVEGLKGVGVEINLPKLLKDQYQESIHRDGQVSNLKERIIGSGISNIPAGVIYDVLEIGIKRGNETQIKPKVVYKYRV